MTPSSTVRRIVDMSAVAVADAGATADTAAARAGTAASTF